MEHAHLVVRYRRCRTRERLRQSEGTLQPKSKHRATQRPSRLAFTKNVREQLRNSYGLRSWTWTPTWKGYAPRSFCNEREAEQSVGWNPSELARKEALTTTTSVALHHEELKMTRDDDFRQSLTAASPPARPTLPLVALKPDAMKRLPVFLKIALDSLGVLTVVLQFALVGVKCRSNFDLHLVL